MFVLLSWPLFKYAIISNRIQTGRCQTYQLVLEVEVKVTQHVQRKRTSDLVTCCRNASTAGPVSKPLFPNILRHIGKAAQSYDFVFVLRLLSRCFPICSSFLRDWENIELLRFLFCYRIRLLNKTLPRGTKSQPLCQLVCMYVRTYVRIYLRIYISSYK